MRMKAISAVLIAAMMLTMAVIPFVGDDSAAAEEAREPVSGGTGIIQLDMYLIIVGQVFIEIGKTIRGWGGFEQTQTNSSDPDEVKAFARKVASEYTAEDLTALAVTVAGLIDNNTETWKLAQSYTDRAAEISAGTNWAPGAGYDAESILVFAGIYRMLATSQDNTSSALAFAIDNMADRVGQWSGTEYSSIGVSIVWDGGGTPVANYSAKLIFTTVATVTQSQNRVYLSSDGTADIWALDGAGQITGDDGQVTYLSSGSNSVALSSGWYTLSSGHYAGPFLPTVNSEGNGAVCQGGAVIAVDGNAGYCCVDDDHLAIRYNGASYSSSYLKYRYTHGSGNAETQTLTGSGTFNDSLANLIRAYSDQYDAYKVVLANASQAGQVMWSLSAAAGESNILLSPSSVSPQLVNVGIDANQSYALYVNALSQISDYYNSYGSQISAEQTRISAQSLQLYCRGSLYNSDGSVIASNVVFTPYVYSKNMTVYSGMNTTFNQDGMVMIWTAPGAVSLLADFTSTDVTAHNTVIMPKGAYIMAEEIVYNGEMTSSMTLHVKEIAKIELLSGMTHANTASPKVLKASTLVMIIMIELAAIFALLGISIAKHPLTFIAAIVILLAGIFFPEEIAKLLVGWLGS